MVHSAISQAISSYPIYQGVALYGQEATHDKWMMIGVAHRRLANIATDDVINPLSHMSSLHALCMNKHT